MIRKYCRTSSWPRTRGNSSGATLANTHHMAHSRKLIPYCCVTLSFSLATSSFRLLRSARAMNSSSATSSSQRSNSISAYLTQWFGMLSYRTLQTLMLRFTTITARLSTLMQALNRLEARLMQMVCLRGPDSQSGMPIMMFSASVAGRSLMSM